MSQAEAGQLHHLCEEALLEAAEMHGYLGGELARLHISEDARQIALARLGGLAGRRAEPALEQAVTALLGAILRRRAAA
ncbi:MAG: hypothetical protein U1E62_03335 [Alsobacter sp.]